MASYKYFAFISYNSRDIAWGKRLQRRLEHYKLPTVLCRQRGLRRKPMRPVFFAPTDIQPGDLSEELKQRLSDSRHLIVIGSPRSAKSEWVGREIAYFHSLGRQDSIHYFIVEGTPNSGDSSTECFNPMLSRLGMPEILGANVNEKTYRWGFLNRERAYAQLISKLLGVDFDTIWKRHKRRSIVRLAGWFVGLVAVAAALIAVWIQGRPVDVGLSLKETGAENRRLPALKDALVALVLDNETKSDTVRGIEDVALFSNIPRKYLGREVRVTFRAKDYLPVDTVFVMSEENVLEIRRDPAVFGKVRFRIWVPEKESYVMDGKVAVNGREIMADDEGYFSTFIPVAEQARFYRVVSDMPLVSDTVYMPCGDNVTLFVR